jgi:predicted PurR-regulated permease PerM
MLGIDTSAARSAWSWSLVILAIVGFFIIRKTVLLFVLSLLFSYLLFPLVEFVRQKFKLQRRLTALVLTFLAIIVAIVGACVLLRAPIRRERNNLIQQIQNQEFAQNLSQWQVLGIPVGQKIIDLRDPAKIQSELTLLMPQLKKGAIAASRDISNIFLIPILAFFMIKDGPVICEAVLSWCFHPCDTAEAIEDRRLIVSSLDDAHSLILQYMRALVLLCFAVLIVFAIVLSLLKVRYAVLLALVAFPLEFIPLFGPVVAAISIVAICEFNHYPHIFWIIIFLIVYRIFQDYVLSPHLMNKSVKLHPLVVIFGIFAGGEIGGVGEIFLSVPLLALARLVFYEYRKRAIKILV